MDGGFANETINLRREFITAENINDLFHKYGVPRDLDFLSIDLDFNDWHVFRSILEHGAYLPKIVCIEFNSHWPPTEARTVRYNGSQIWDGKSRFFGASVRAIEILGRRHGYRLFYCESHGVNCFLVHESLVQLAPEDENELSGRAHRKPNFFGRNLSYPEGKGRWVAV